MAKPGKKGIPRIIDATGYSISGLKIAWKNEAAFRQESAFVIIGLLLASSISNTISELLWLTLPLFILLIAELANTAIEAVVDRVGHEHHELSGQAKDVGSAMVFISLMLVLFVWSIVIFSKWSV